MKHSFHDVLKKMLEKRKQKTLHNRIIGFLCLCMVLGTTYTLMLPAIAQAIEDVLDEFEHMGGQEADDEAGNLDGNEAGGEDSETDNAEDGEPESGAEVQDGENEVPRSDKPWLALEEVRGFADVFSAGGQNIWDLYHEDYSLCDGTLIMGSYDYDENDEEEETAYTEDLTEEENEPEGTGTDETVIKETPIDKTEIEETPIDKTEIEETPIDKTEIEEIPIDKTEIEEIPIDKTEIEDTPIDKTGIEETPIDKTEIEETPTDKTEIEEIPTDKTKTEETPIDETGIEETPVDDTEIESVPTLVLNDYLPDFDLYDPSKTYVLEISRVSYVMDDEDEILFDEFDEPLLEYSEYEPLDEEMIVNMGDKLRLTVYYSDIPVNKLYKAGGEMIFVLPEVEPLGSLLSQQDLAAMVWDKEYEPVGMVETEQYDSYLYFTFDSDWLKKKSKNKQDAVMKGKFCVETYVIPDQPAGFFNEISDPLIVGPSDLVREERFYYDGTQWVRGSYYEHVGADNIWTLHEGDHRYEKDEALKYEIQFDIKENYSTLVANGGKLQFEIPDYIKDYTSDSIQAAFGRNNDISASVSVNGRIVTIQITDPDWIKKMQLQDELTGFLTVEGKMQMLYFNGDHGGDTISNLQLLYQPEDSISFIPLTSGVTLKGNEKIRISATCRIHRLDLLLHGGMMCYDELPSYLRIDDEKPITYKGQTVGILTALSKEGGQAGEAYFVFNEGWRDQITQNDIEIDFFCESSLNYGEIINNGGHLVIGNQTININFEDDMISKYATVRVEKNHTRNEGDLYDRVIETPEGDFVEYTIKATSGPDGMPNVIVKDSFTANGTFVERYDQIGSSAAVLGSSGVPRERIVGGGASPQAGTVRVENGTMIWQIGNMQPNEVRELTYRVKLKQDYTSVKAKNALKNTATVFSGPNQKHTATDYFTPRIAANITKENSGLEMKSDGTGEITYTLKIRADSTNSYTLDHVKIADEIKELSKELRVLLTYDPDSFWLTSDKDSNCPVKLTANRTKADYTVAAWRENEDKWGVRYDAFIGTLAPGETKTLTYKITIGKDLFVYKNDLITFTNSARIYTWEQKENQQLSAASNVIEATNKKWDRKLQNGAPTTETQTISMGSNGSFTLPAGSYRYQVVVNEKGDWDVSGAAFKDSLGSSLMEFVGYMQIDAYDVQGYNAANPTHPIEIATSTDDRNVIARLEAMDSSYKVTRWTEISGGNFNITPDSIGGIDGEKAYVLTYYAAPKAGSSFNNIIVSNTFNLSGTVVGNGGVSYTMAGIQVQVNSSVSGFSSFKAEKQSWYYEKPTVNSGNYSKGTIYWGITANGDIAANTVFKDDPKTGGGLTGHVLRADAVENVYIVNGEMIELGTFNNKQALTSSGIIKSTLVNGTDYSVTYSGSGKGSIQITMLTDKHLASNETMLVVMKSEPDSLITVATEVRTYRNGLEVKENGSNSFIPYPNVDFIQHGSDDHIIKEYIGALSYSGSGKATGFSNRPANSGDFSVDFTGGKPGIYLEYRITVNTAGTLNGDDFVITDYIPEGLELSYVRTFHLGKTLVKQLKSPYRVTKESPSLLADGWTKRYHKTYCQNVTGPNTETYYYTKDNEMKLVLANMRAQEDCRVSFQVMCRVNDPKVLLGGEEGVYDNVASMVDSEGRNFGSSDAEAKIKFDTISKNSLAKFDPDGNLIDSSGLATRTYPFKIVINDKGEDLIEGADQITVVDEMSKSLILNVNTIKIYTHATDNTKQLSANEWTASFDDFTDPDKNILEITVPDSKYLRIEYDTMLSGVPGQEIRVSNIAYWKGYKRTDVGEVDGVHKFQSGAEVLAPVALTVHKVDANGLRDLAGATFKILKLETKKNDDTDTITILCDDQGIPLNSVTGLPISATDASYVPLASTDNEGKIVYREPAYDAPEDLAQNHLKRHDVYCLIESNAPAGYVLDQKPFYFSFAPNQAASGMDASYYTYEFSYDYANEKDRPELHVVYGEAEYTYTAYNRKAYAVVQKRFLDTEGQLMNTGITGTYRFGLFDQAGGGGSPLQTVEIRYENGQFYPAGGQARFEELTLGNTYYIYELDRDGKPISNGDYGIISDRQFIAAYQSSSGGADSNVVQPDATEIPVVTVTNQPKYDELPHTGGAGTWKHTLGGVLLTAFSLMYWYILRRRRERRCQ